MLDLIHLRTTLLAALGVTSACSAPGQGPALVDLPPPGADTTKVDGEARPPRAGRGYVKEPNGNVHRASVVTCDSTNPQPACRGDEGMLQCSSDADCKEGPHGKCVTGVGQIGTFCGCEYACETDDECKTGEACVCAEHAGRPHSVCAPATCKADADCPSGACGVSSHFNGCWVDTRLTCRSAKDRCTSDADCAGGRPDAPGGSCRANAEGWSCQNVSCAIGRPFVVEGDARVASSAPRSDWLDEALAERLAPGAARADELTRARVARRTLEVAAMEHASVASFTRASLELLALGAPPGLLADTHAAAADEVRHARIAFSVARAYGAGSVGPGELDLAGALPRSIEPRAVARAVAFEGCVGETLGAAEARHAASGCADPLLAATWSAVAADELAHAALAWRTLAWLCETFGEDARRGAAEGLASGLVQHAGTEPDGDAVGAPEHGVLGAADLVATRRAVAADVIVPAARAMGFSLEVTPAA